MHIVYVTYQVYACGRVVVELQGQLHGTLSLSGLYQTGPRDQTGPLPSATIQRTNPLGDWDTQRHRHRHTKLCFLSGHQVMVFEDVRDCFLKQRRCSSQRLLVSKKMTAKEVLVSLCPTSLILFFHYLLYLLLCGGQLLLSYVYSTRSFSLHVFIHPR